MTIPSQNCGAFMGSFPNNDKDNFPFTWSIKIMYLGEMSACGGQKILMTHVKAVP